MYHLDFSLVFDNNLPVAQRFSTGDNSPWGISGFYGVGSTDRQTRTIEI